LNPACWAEIRQLAYVDESDRPLGTVYRVHCVSAETECSEDSPRFLLAMAKAVIARAEIAKASVL